MEPLILINLTSNVFQFKGLLFMLLCPLNCVRCHTNHKAYITFTVNVIFKFCNRIYLLKLPIPHKKLSIINEVTQYSNYTGIIYNIAAHYYFLRQPVSVPPPSYHTPDWEGPPSYHTPDWEGPPSYHTPDWECPASYHTPDREGSASYHTLDWKGLPSHQTHNWEGPSSYHTPDSEGPPSYHTPDWEGPASYHTPDREGPQLARGWLTPFMRGSRVPHYTGGLSLLGGLHHCH